MLCTRAMVRMRRRNVPRALAATSSVDAAAAIAAWRDRRLGTVATAVLTSAGTTRVDTDGSPPVAVLESADAGPAASVAHTHNASSARRMTTAMARAMPVGAHAVHPGLQVHNSRVVEAPARCDARSVAVDAALPVTVGGIPSPTRARAVVRDATGLMRGTVTATKTSKIA